MFPTDVDRHFVELETQLVVDNADDASDVVKTLKRLRQALSKDGFTLAPQESKSDTTTTMVAKSPDYLIRAFRVGSATDAETVSAIFEEIDGWKARTFDVKGQHFVVVTNAPRWSKKRLRSVLSPFLQAGKASAGA